MTHSCTALLWVACVVMLWAPPSAAEAPDPQAVTLRVWDYPRWSKTPDSVDRFHWMRGQVAVFERAHPHVRIDFTRLSWEYGADKVRIAVLAGAGPDLIAGAPMTEFIARNLVEPVDAYLDAEDRRDYLPSALKAFTLNDHTWGWPWYQTGSVLLLNADRFAAAQVPLPPDGRWTHAEFETTLAQLSAGDETPAAPAFGFSAQAALGIWPWLFPGDTPIVSDGPDSLLARTVPDGLRRLRRYISDGWAPAGSGGLAPGPVWEAFVTHKRTAIVPLGIWAIPALRERAEFPFAVAHYPGDARTFVAVSGWMVLRHGDAARRDAAMAFARQLSAADAQRDLRAYGVFPTRRSAGNLYADDPEMARAAEVLAAGRPVPLHAEWAQIQRAVTILIQDGLTADTPIEPMVAVATARLRDRLGEASARSVQRSERPQQRVRGGTWGVLAAAVAVGVFLLAAGRGAHRRTAMLAAPALIVLAALMLWPLLWSLALSFATFNVATGWFGEWVGLHHYRTLLGDAVFRTAVRNTIVYTAVVVPGQVAIALVLASLIAPLGDRTRAWFRGAFYLPGVTSVVVLSVVWRWLFDEQAGALNGLLGFWGVGSVRWLSDPGIALWSIILMTLARPPGGPMLIYLAALDALPRHLFDAAALDGASRVQRWWRVAVPLLAPTTGFLMVTGVIGAFQVFAQIYVLTDGGPGTATTVLVHQIYTTAMREFAFGRASAMAVILAVLLAVAAYVSSRRRGPAVQY